MSDLQDVLGESVQPAPTKKARAPKANGAAAPKAKKAAAGKVAKTATKPAKAAPTKAEKKPAKVKPKSDVSTTQPEDKVVLAAVRKLKAPTLAAEFASGLGVHRRVIRAQLQRLAKDKANGVKMVKQEYNWLVSNTSK